MSKRFAHAGLVGLAMASGVCVAHAADPCDFVSSGASSFSYRQVRQCYESVPFRAADLDNILSVVAQHRSFSDLLELHTLRRDKMLPGSPFGLAALERRYPNDWAMHAAIQAEHRTFRSLHIVYVPPMCYWGMLDAFVPFDFGVTTRFRQPHERQIVFIEGIDLAELYQSATGIDSRDFVGMKVVSINGTPVLEYFRQYGREQIRLEDDGVELNAILNDSAYSHRRGMVFHDLPDRPFDDYVLESRGGHRIAVRMPWVFAPASVLMNDPGHSFTLPLTATTPEFVDRCLQPPPPPVTATEGDFSAGGALDSLAFHGHPLSEWTHRKHHGSRAHRDEQRGAATRRAAFYEVPPDEVGKDIRQIVEPTSGAQVQQYGDDVTVLRLDHSNVSWIDVARTGVEYACQHSKRLIVDLRRNGGGVDFATQWLHRHLFPEQTSLAASGKVMMRYRNDRPPFREFLRNAAAFDALYVPQGHRACELSLVFGAGCLVDVDAGTTMPLERPDWFEHPWFMEDRAGARVKLTRQFVLGFTDQQQAVFDAASCAGRFRGEDLIFLTDGVNASGGYFLPAAFEGEGIIVTMGGYVGERMPMGQAGGGMTLPVFAATAAAQMQAQSKGLVSFEHSFLGFTRDVGSTMEMAGAYRKDRRRLHLEAPVESDLHLDVWSDSPGTEGYVYRRLLELVDRHR